MKLVAQVPVEQADTDMKPHVMEFKKAMPTWCSFG